MQIQNFERFFVIGRSRIVDVVDEEQRQRTMRVHAKADAGSGLP